jgi:RhtB (resistance to homoserine/threonine) family protein
MFRVWDAVLNGKKKIHRMTETWILIGTISIIHFLAVASPGPDFLMCVRNSLQYSRRIGIWTAVGFCLAVLIHIAYCLAGIAVLISQSILLFNAVKILGGIYLLYIGLMAFFSPPSSTNIEHLGKKKKMISPARAIWIGFLTNLLNPKATLYFLSLFTLVLHPETPFTLMLLLVGIMLAIMFIWFSFVAIFFTLPSVQKLYKKSEALFQKIFGTLLVLLGIKVVFSKNE